MTAKGRVGCAAAAAFVVGSVVFFVVMFMTTFAFAMRGSLHHPDLARTFPLPHHVPEFPGGLSFRFAMVNDVIHERFARHGPDYYRERNRIVREKLAAIDPDDPAVFPLMDDLGVGLERLGKSDEAAAVLRDKLARQEAKGIEGRDLYTSYANLGTFLIHGGLARAAAGDADAREQVREGLAFIRKAVEVNPEAHFGRERWQLAIVEFLLAAMEDPALLTKFDCVGDRVDVLAEPEAELARLLHNPPYGRAYDPWYSEALMFGQAQAEDRAWVRDRIAKVGAEDGWKGVDVPSHREPVPFDEPVLGIIGMWREGGGASPHFALALGEIMLRVGQRLIAWSAFERASRLADRYSSTSEARDFLREHCRKRQEEIEQVIAPFGAVENRLRAAFDAELAFGQGYQKDYQDFEAAKIAAGGSILDDRFHDDFPRRGEPIASPSGGEEWVEVVPRADAARRDASRARALAVFWAGLAAFATSAGLRLLAKRRVRRTLGSRS